MTSITFQRFELGEDTRKGPAVSDANRLRAMINAHVTTGMAAQKRPGLVHVATLEPGTKGLVAAQGKLNTFHDGGSAIMHANTLFNSNMATPAGSAIVDVTCADVLDGYIYAAIKYLDGQTVHHYFDGSPSSRITDTGCPHTSIFVKAAQKIFAVSPDGATVRYTATSTAPAGRSSNPRDWSTPSDAGFLATHLYTSGDRTTRALGLYQRKLVALARDAAQIWTVDPDPTNMALDDVVENVGTNYPQSLATVGGDLFFLSDFGFRSITTNRLIDKREDVDVGSPIDNLVEQALENPTGTPRAGYYYGTGQYICAIGQTIYAYKVSRTAKIAAWSRYAIPFQVDAMAELEGVLYLRTGDDVYKLSKNVYTDNGEEYEVLIELPYMDFKAPGVLKQVYGIDLVMEGECHISVGFDAREPEAFTQEVRVIGGTRGGGMIPVECCGTEFSLRFRNLDDKPFRLDAVTVHYNALGLM